MDHTMYALFLALHPSQLMCFCDMFQLHHARQPKRKRVRPCHILFTTPLNEFFPTPKKERGNENDVAATQFLVTRYNNRHHRSPPLSFHFARVPFQYSLKLRCESYSGFTLFAERLRRGSYLYLQFKVVLDTCNCAHCDFV